MSTAFVQYSDSSKTEIIAVFSCEQDLSEYPNQGTVDTDSHVYQTYLTSINSMFPFPIPLLAL